MKIRFVVMLGLFVNACGGGGTSTAPTTASTIALPSDPLGPAPAFALSVSRFTVQLFGREGQDVYQYEPVELVLSETGGKSGAALLRISVTASPSSGEPEQDCTSADTGRGVVIGAGETIDLKKVMGYCMPYFVTRSLVSQVAFTATFADDAGRSGVVQQSVNVAGCTLNGGRGLVTCVP